MPPSWGVCYTGRVVDTLKPRLSRRSHDIRVRTYDLKPGSVAQYEENFGNALKYREQYSKLAAFWHTEIGPLNQIIHVWPYENMDERERIRAESSKDPNWPPPSNGAILNMNSEIWTPAPFMKPMGGDQALGNIYEMRTYTYQQARSRS